MDAKAAHRLARNMPNSSELGIDGFGLWDESFTVDYLVITTFDGEQIIAHNHKCFSLLQIGDPLSNM